ncbi:ABC transporter [Bacteroidetes bacterium UKL13-3]|jgi:predicted unusual protein kinase regulating ubiquinone biosynthesis (AarF/ABC1/UbiB family)|nr:ABC transporter [Bacteroidetes bacterium UKL13-3]HCP92929.1 ABC transporter [Bacteroidota bacterium]
MEQNSIPSSKVERAMRFVKTGAQIGGNYIKHYSKKMVDPSLSKDQLHEDNATDVYNALSELKGSALKVAQMLSMEKNVLPRQYTNKFQMAQYSAPPLSGPLIVQTFVKAFGKTPHDLFDTFNLKASNAASIGQVHEATLNGKKLAIKIQYPGVAESIKSDLKMVKPIAFRLLDMNEKELDKYIKEVEGKLLEETDYELEYKRSVEISTLCATIPNLVFTKYYQEFTTKRVLAMDWLEGFHLDEFLKTNPSQEIRDRVGQAMWDFYDYQVHVHKAVHADPHPGNFLMREDGTLGVIDFGCVKEIPEDFYYNYFALLVPEIMKDISVIKRIMLQQQIISKDDSEQTQQIITDAFVRMTNLLRTPFDYEVFDFGDNTYIDKIYALGEEVSKMDELKKSKEGRGSQHALYINRTYFGLYSMLNVLQARVNTGLRDWAKPLVQYHLAAYN